MKSAIDPPVVSRLLALLIIGLAFALRLAYAIHSHPFYDEFTTLLASTAIVQTGLPILPSGLFYEHGLLYNYVAAPFTWLAQTAGPQEKTFLMVRLSSVLIGTACTALIYALGHRWISPLAGLMAALLFALSPEGMVWGGRIRMYALAQLLLLLTVFLAYTGLRRKRAALRWLALLSLLAALLTQFASIIFVPPLIIALLVVHWPQLNTRQKFLHEVKRFLPEGIGLVLVLGLGVLSKRLGQPLGVAQLGTPSAGNPLLALWETIAYQAGLNLDWASAVKFLGRQFGVPHHLWLTGLVLLGLGLSFMLMRRQRHQHVTLFLSLVFGLTILEMISVVEPFRRNPRYVLMGLPLFYLLAGASGQTLVDGLRKTWRTPGFTWQKLTWGGAILAGLSLTGLHVQGWYTGWQIAWRTPEPAYERAFHTVADEWQAGDIVLSMNASAAGLYLAPDDFYFAVQNQAEQFLLDYPQDPVDRWLGRPWVGNSQHFNRLLNENPRAWFVVDTIRLPEYYRGSWQSVLNSQMDLVWAEDDALLYRSKPESIPLPTAPAVKTEVVFGDLFRLDGYTLTQVGDALHLSLFWTTLAESPTDYTMFLHLRQTDPEAQGNQQQWDRQPFNASYPTSQWQANESLTDVQVLPLSADINSEQYYLALGFYNLESLERLPLQSDTSGENALFLAFTGPK